MQRGHCNFWVGQGCHSSWTPLSQCTVPEYRLSSSFFILRVHHPSQSLPFLRSSHCFTFTIILYFLCFSALTFSHSVPSFFLSFWFGLLLQRGRCFFGGGAHGTVAWAIHIRSLTCTRDPVDSSFRSSSAITSSLPPSFVSCPADLLSPTHMLMYINNRCLQCLLLIQASLSARNWTSRGSVWPTPWNKCSNSWTSQAG